MSWGLLWTVICDLKYWNNKITSEWMSAWMYRIMSSNPFSQLSIEWNSSVISNSRRIVTGYHPTQTSWCPHFHHSCHFGDLITLLVFQSVTILFISIQVWLDVKGWSFCLKPNLGAWIENVPKQLDTIINQSQSCVLTSIPTLIFWQNSHLFFYYNQPSEIEILRQI